MPDIAKLLWPKTVAVVGASSDLHGLRGRILQTMLEHPFQGTIYPVSRSASEVQGLKAYPSVADLPEPADLAILIIPAEFIPDELERCGRAGVGAAVILSSGFAEEKGGAGAHMQRTIREIAQRYDMAVTGPNSEGFANIANDLIPTFSPAMELSAGPIRPTIPLGKGQVSVISQSGGVGFAFFDRARERNLTFRYVVTTGNEAALETSDLLDFMLDEGKTDVFLVLLEDVEDARDVPPRRGESGPSRQAADRLQDRPERTGPARGRLAHRRARRFARRLPRHLPALWRHRRPGLRRNARSRRRVRHVR